ncbi:WXG100 family type VII secretion target [Oryzihumus sp.]
MTDPVVLGDPAGCSRLGGAMRREAAHLTDRAATLARTGAGLAQWRGPAGSAARDRVTVALTGMAATAKALDQAGAALQRYATELAEAHEQGRRTADRAARDGLRVVDGRVLEAWGPATSEEAERRRALVPEHQARVDRLSSGLGRSRAKLQRTCEELTQVLRAQSRALRDAPPPRA